MGQVGVLTGKRKAYAVETLALGGTAGDYAMGPRFGATAAGQGWDSFQGVTIGVETSVTSMVVELWLAKLSVAQAGTRSFKEYTNDDFFYSGQALDAATGAETFALAGWPCFEVRVKSGGTGGSPVIAATAF
jgi:hypothetical protein